MAIKFVTALIKKNNKILLAKRAKGNLVGSWEFPGGKIEKGEKPFDAIEREIFEELGVKVSAKKRSNLSNTIMNSDWYDLNLLSALLMTS